MIVQEIPFKNNGYTFNSYSSLNQENTFQVTHLISQTDQVIFYAVVNNYMIFSVRNDVTNEEDILEFTNAFEESFELASMTMSKEVAVSPMGFAFI